MYLEEVHFLKLLIVLAFSDLSLKVKGLNSTGFVKRVIG